MKRKRGVEWLTVTGASTLWTLLSSTRISMALRHRAFTSDSFRGSHLFNCSICLSKSDDISSLSLSLTVSATPSSPLCSSASNLLPFAITLSIFQYIFQIPHSLPGPNSFAFHFLLCRILHQIFFLSSICIKTLPISHSKINTNLFVQRFISNHYHN